MKPGKFWGVIDRPPPRYPERRVSAHIGLIYFICSTFPLLLIKLWIMFSHFSSPESHTIKGHEHPAVLLIAHVILIDELFKLMYGPEKRSHVLYFRCCQRSVKADKC